MAEKAHHRPNVAAAPIARIYPITQRILLIKFENNNKKFFEIKKGPKRPLNNLIKLNIIIDVDQITAST